jgi:hypothetical protein
MSSVVGVGNTVKTECFGVRIQPIPVAELSKTRVCGQLFPMVEGSNPAGSVDIVVCCKKRQRENRRTVKTDKT